MGGRGPLARAGTGIGLGVAKLRTGPVAAIPSLWLSLGPPGLGGVGSLATGGIGGGAAASVVAAVRE